MKCGKCGAKLPDVARFCLKCGTEIKSIETTKNVNNAEGTVKQTILNENDMKQLSQIMGELELTSIEGMPAWDTFSSDSKCDCAVGECDCDGSIWS